MRRIKSLLPMKQDRGEKVKEEKMTWEGERGRKKKLIILL